MVTLSRPVFRSVARVLIVSVPTGSVEPPSGQDGRPPRRVLVISATIGAGHNAAARSIQQTARWLWRQSDLRRLDVLDVMGRGVGGILRWLYVVNVQLTPWFYEFFYGALWAYRWAAKASKRLVGSWSGRQLATYIEAYDPDLVVSTHPIASAGLDWLRRHRGLEVPVGVWVLDFATHPFWLYRGLGLHVVMHESCAEIARAAEPGISLRVGAPTVGDAFRSGDRAAARSRLGLASESFVVLLSCGYFGFGTVERAVDTLLDIDPRVQVVAICGRNERLRRRLAARGLSPARLLLLGWIDDMASNIVASDLVVTNAGGATALETLCCGRTLVLFEPIAAHGRANTEIMAGTGLALLCSSPRELTRVVRQLMDDPSRRSEQEERSLAFARRRNRTDDLRALVPLATARAQRRGPLRPRSRRFRPHRNGHRPTGGGPRQGKPRREVVRPEDAFFLYTQTPAVAQQVGGIAILERSSLTFPEVMADMERRMDGLPNLRRRLIPPRRRWGRPSWIVDESIDLSEHLKERVIGAVGQPQTFAELVDDFFSTPVNLDRAPWEMHFVRGLDHGGSALVVKLHHAMGDGFAVIDTLSGLLDDARHPNDRAAEPPPKPQGSVNGKRLGPARTKIRDAALVVSGFWSLARAGRAPISSLNGPMGTPSRHYVSVSLPAGEIREAARNLKVTSSELLLAIVADAVHRLLAERGEPERSLRAIVPRTMRTMDGRMMSGNWTGGVRVNLPVGPMDPLSRLQETQARLRRGLRHGEPEAARFLMRAMGVLPAPFEAWLARWTYRSRWFNLIVSVIPGPRQPYSFVGVRLEEVYPVLPLAEEVGLSVGVLSWGDSFTVGITADVTLVSDADRLVDGVRESFVALHQVALR
ncbi:MAG: DUF1298 domain-containing protein [Streptosporangiales bacterium]|nr:DUF1298 domain-containing protein [Streptosporangiales bacterium]